MLEVWCCLCYLFIYLIMTVPIHITLLINNYYAFKHSKLKLNWHLTTFEIAHSMHVYSIVYQVIKI